jgi:hypothetical protein
MGKRSSSLPIMSLWNERNWNKIKAIPQSTGPLTQLNTVLFVAFFFLGGGESPASEFYVPVFRNNLFHFQKGCLFLFTPPMKMEQTECSKTSVYKIQTPGNRPQKRIQDSEHGESFKSKMVHYSLQFMFINMFRSEKTLFKLRTTLSQIQV